MCCPPPLHPLSSLLTATSIVFHPLLRLHSAPTPAPPPRPCQAFIHALPGAFAVNDTFAPALFGTYSAQYLSAVKFPFTVRTNLTIIAVRSLAADTEKATASKSVSYPFAPICSRLRSLLPGECASFCELRFVYAVLMPLSLLLRVNLSSSNARETFRTHGEQRCDKDEEVCVLEVLR